MDRVAENTDEFVGSIPGITDPLTGGENLWAQFQRNIESFINDPVNGGSAQKLPYKVIKPDWELLKQVKSGARPVSDLGCK